MHLASTIMTLGTTTTATRMDHDGQHCMRPCRAFQPVDNPYVETIVHVVGAVKMYLVLLALLLWGYACAFYVLYTLPHPDAPAPAPLAGGAKAPERAHTDVSQFFLSRALPVVPCTSASFSFSESAYLGFFYISYFALDSCRCAHACTCSACFAFKMT